MIKLKYLDNTQVEAVWDAALVEKLSDALNKKYLSFLEDEVMMLEAGFDKNQVQVKMTLKKNDNSLFYPIEAVFIIDPEVKITNVAAAELMLDYLDTYWNEYFTDHRDVFVSLDWSKHSCDNANFYVRGFVRNSGLESAADALLRQHGFGEYNIEPISSET